MKHCEHTPLLKHAAAMKDCPLPTPGNATILAAGLNSLGATESISGGSGFVYGRMDREDYCSATDLDTMLGALERKCVGPITKQAHDNAMKMAMEAGADPSINSASRSVMAATVTKPMTKTAPTSIHSEDALREKVECWIPFQSTNTPPPDAVRSSSHLVLHNMNGPLPVPPLGVGATQEATVMSKRGMASATTLRRTNVGVIAIGSSNNPWCYELS